MVTFLAVLGILLAISVLGALDIANLYVARRALQNVADLAVLAAVQTMDDGCVQPLASATANAASNGFIVSSSQTLSVTCGRWDANGTDSGMTFVPDGATPFNGAQVSVTRMVPYFFLGPQRQLTASATAQATNTDTFSVGTTLVQVNLLNGLLSGLLGTHVDLSLASWNGLANANIRLADLVAQANAGTVDGLLDMKVTAADLVQLMLGVLQKNAVADTNVQAAIAGLDALLAANLPGSSPIPLRDRPGAPGLLSLGLADTQAALNATITPLQALIVGAEIAQTGQPPIGLNVDLGGVSGTLPAGLQLAVQVIEPPTIAVGQAGLIPGTTTWRTVARTAQILVRLNIGLGTSSLGIPLLSDLLNVSVQVPLFVEAAPATAWLQSIDCAPTADASRMVIGAQTGLLNMCIGEAPASLSPTDAFRCDQPATIANASLLTVPVATVTAAVPLAASIPAASAPALTFDGSGTPLGDDTVNANQLGPLLSGTLAGTSAALEQDKGLSVTLLSSVQVPTGRLLGLVVGILEKLLAPVLETLSNALIAPLLQLLGVQVGVATVTAGPLACGTAQLVH